jgi:hypothetical protein
MLGVVKLVPVLKALPPVKAPYHEIVPPVQPLAVMLTAPGPQLLPPALLTKLTTNFAAEIALQAPSFIAAFIEPESNINEFAARQLPPTVLPLISTLAFVRKPASGGKQS